MLNNIKVLLGILIVVAGFAYYVMQSDSNDISETRYLLPDWQSDTSSIQSINKVLLEKQDEVIALNKVDGKWTVNGGFFVDIQPLSELIQSLKNAEVVELKTANPDNHDQLELGQDDLQVKLFINDETKVHIHVGKNNSSGHVFIRKGDENQTFTVKNLKTIVFNQDNWMMKTVLDIPEQEVYSVVFNPNEGDSFEITRNKDDMTLELVNMPDNHQIKTGLQMNNLVSGLSSLMIDEALPKQLDDMSLQTKINYQLNDGSDVNLVLYQKEETFYMTISGKNYTHYDPWMMKVAAYKFKALNKTLSDIVEPITEVQQQQEEPLE